MQQFGLDSKPQEPQPTDRLMVLRVDDVLQYPPTLGHGVQARARQAQEGSCVAWRLGGAEQPRQSLTVHDADGYNTEGHNRPVRALHNDRLRTAGHPHAQRVQRSLTQTAALQRVHWPDVLGDSLGVAKAGRAKDQGHPPTVTSGKMPIRVNGRGWRWRRTTVASVQSPGASSMSAKPVNRSGGCPYGVSGVRNFTG